MKIKNMLNASEFDKNYEYNNQKSQTIPDQAMSIKEILARYSRGLPVEQFKPHYDEAENTDDYFPDPRTMDLAERQEFAEQVRQELAEIAIQRQQKQQETTNESEKPTE